MKYIKLFENFKEWEELGGSESGSESGSKSYSLLDFINSSKDTNTVKIWEPFWKAVASKQKTIDINLEWNEIIKMNSQQLIDKLDVSMEDAKDIESFFQEKI